jgi:hypothetical protein
LPLKLEGVKTYPLKSRFSKVSVADFVRVGKDNPHGSS